MQRRAELIKAKGHSFAAEWLTPSTIRPGPTLVFLHEGLGCIGMWREFPARLCERLSLEGFLYDRLGHGRSDVLLEPRTPRYLHVEAAPWLPAVLEGAGIAHPILVGHSDGGTIALLFAAAFPPAPAAIVTIAAHIYVEEVTLEGIRAAVDGWKSGKLRLGLERWHGTKAQALVNAWACTWLSAPFRSWDVREDLATIACPVLALQGEADQYATPRHLRDIVSLSRATGALLPDRGHSPHLEDWSLPERVAVWIEDKLELR